MGPAMPVPQIDSRKAPHCDGWDAIGIGSCEGYQDFDEN